ncbi:RNA polymerase sigma-70 factor [Chitinophaga solisilvae]|uniref:RNA polymerase sigma-70 factor n=1 Tax=Chitinophaga solisilvae TaxID=1233460 RepID=A0A433WI77_9BACT|nr:RNA polymerase sigma-70 factor [Chitinophaga solisilvae]NSL85434.1 RNA polymerase sigma-70 factor [Chitinophaga solisilvae]
MDEHLITGGDQEQLVERAFHLYFEGLHRYAFTILKDNDEAKDAVQSVFLKLWEKRAGLDEQQSVKSYLYTAVYHYCLNIKRHEKVKDSYISASSNVTGVQEHALVSKETYQQILQHIEALSPQCRIIFCKSRFDGMKYAEIAAEMGLSVKTVEVQMGKALRILREKLSEFLVTLIIFYLL